MLNDNSFLNEIIVYLRYSKTRLTQISWSSRGQEGQTKKRNYKSQIYVAKS